MNTRFNNFFLSIINRFLLKYNKTVRKTINYADARNIGIMFKIPVNKNEPKEDKNLETFKNFVKKLKNDMKKVQGITFYDKKNPYNFKHYNFTRWEITYLGSLRSEKVKKFIDTDFDYLFCIDINPSTVFENILIKSKAKCRIGKYASDKTKYFELMIKIGDNEDIDVLIDQMKHYTQEL